MRMLGVLAVVLSVSACHSAKPVQAPPPAQPAPANPNVLSEAEGLRTMRTVLSDEISKGRAGYRSLSELVEGLPTLGASTAADGTTAALKGYRLRLTVSEDRKHFQASLTPETGCGTSWFGNDQSLIYVGRPLGCAVN